MSRKHGQTWHYVAQKYYVKGMTPSELSNIIGCHYQKAAILIKSITGIRPERKWS